MALNTSRRNHLTPLRFKGLKVARRIVLRVSDRSFNESVTGSSRLCCSLEPCNGFVFGFVFVDFEFVWLVDMDAWLQRVLCILCDFDVFPWHYFVDSVCQSTVNMDQ